MAPVFFVAWTSIPAASLVNPSFEASADEENWTSDVALAWPRWGEWMNRETGWFPAKDGECMLGYHHWRIINGETSGVYQDVSGVPADTDCEFSVYAFKDDETNAQSVELRIEALGGGEVIASETFSMGKLSADKWIKIVVIGAPRTEGVRVLIVITPAESDERAGALKFDEAALSF